MCATIPEKYQCICRRSGVVASEIHETINH